MSNYKINLHAHTIFSDGANTPLAMAMEAKRLGHTALVLSDHYYGAGDWHNLNKEKYRLLKKATKEATKITGLPVIIGIELCFHQEEILVFGSSLIRTIIEHRDADRPLSVALLEAWKQEHYSAFVLCHPGDPENWQSLRPLLDGFERYNSGQDQFNDRPCKALFGLPQWCNSDAHQVEGLDRAWNEISHKITDEAGLIKYIKKGLQPEFYLKHRD
jgi:predicted metal-dependent phosphoesterase TrpH